MLIATTAIVGADPLVAAENAGIGVFAYDDANVPEDVLDPAKAVAARIFRAIGVDLVWLDRGDERLAEVPTLRSMIALRLLSRDTASRGRAREGVVGKAVSGSRVVKVLYHHLAHVSQVHGADIASVLGHVIAHEIGHVLLPPNAHSRSGVMQPVLNVRRVTNRTLFFTADQGRIIRRAATSEGSRLMVSR